MRLSELMQPEVLTTFPEESLADAAIRMRDHGVGALPVLSGDDLVGIVTERDLMRAMADGAATHVTKVASYQSAAPVVAGPETDTTTAARLMVEYEMRHLPVVSGSRLVGMISARDLLVLEGWPLEPARTRLAGTPE